MSALRLGSIQFVNSLPVDLGLLNGRVKSHAAIEQATPMGLNQHMTDKRLDVSPVSALWFAEHAEDLFVLPELSISSECNVESVLLFSRLPMAQLKGHRIGITGKGRTTPALLEILCRERFGFAPKLELWDPQAPADAGQVPAVLLIGDEALVMKEIMRRERPQVTDLAEVWRSWTGLPFVFALWAVRKEVFWQRADDVWALHADILRSKAWGTAHYDEVLSEARRRTALSDSVLRDYFSKLSYGFDENLKSGLRQYFSYARKHGLISQAPEWQLLPRTATAGDRR